MTICVMKLSTQQYIVTYLQVALVEEKESSLVAKLRLPQFVSESEQAGQNVKDHVESGGTGSTAQEKDENSLFILGDTPCDAT